MALLERLYRKEGAFAVALFANDELTLDTLDEQHLIFRLPIKGLWRPKPVLYQADSFLFAKDDTLYLFYELQHWDDPGVIAMRKTKDLRSWSEPVVVLRQPFHLSFPYVFEDNGQVYMVPESQESDAIHLFRADNKELTSFSKVRTLLRQERTEGIHYNYNDSHIYRQDGVYYLFTSYQKDWMYYQELYTTDDLLAGTFRPHPKSPVCKSNEFGRNGGSLLHFNGHLLRVTQDCHSDYGDNVSLMAIDILTPDDYREHVFQRNVLPANGIFRDGGHQLNIARFKDRYVYATDYKQNRWAWYRLWVALRNRIKR
ncbi:MAG: family 43 glycosylhydrolase [Prevotella sp.]|nr:family 43 glycosylhydrolase [Prevotella sp.]